MRLWTVHPKYLDAAGLVAAWREGLLAQQVLRGRTKGYRFHPQLVRFKSHAAPLACIATYLNGLYDEACARGYRFDASKIGRRGNRPIVTETLGQLLHEWQHLRRKLRKRAPKAFRRLSAVDAPEPHPLFRIVPGRVREWERAPGPATRRRRDAS
ncbi:MAG TPA: pyrimidine dimer DNA glycosylase/endonuclease V [Vicinamibacterales bacterium]|nr:pyrimidine dimer DNA glycosylase/endonuclease V [Vicinamibacterales bacterium]